MVLLQGFVSGYDLGYENATRHAATKLEGKGLELCMPFNLTMGEMYEDMLPHLPEGLGVLDFSLLIAARKAYPCDGNP